MLFVLTGEIQGGKTRWLEGLIDELAEAGVVCAGVTAPGIWRECAKPTAEAGDAGTFEKLGIRNRLLPDGTLIDFALRSDIAQREGAYDEASQSAQARLGWAIADDALGRVNAHLDSLAASGSSTPPSGAVSRLLVIDEVGRLELLRGRGITSALALLDAGPTPAYSHALIVVRAQLLETACRRFAPAWGEPHVIEPGEEARRLVLATLLG